MSAGVRWVADRRRGDRRTASGLGGFLGQFLTLVAGLLVLVIAGLILHGGPVPPQPTAVTLLGGAERASTQQLTATAAEELDQALTGAGTGIEFEIVQTSTITARPDGPLVDIPDPTDRAKTLGTAERYVMGTLIERGFATPDGYWMELIHGPAPGAEADYDLASAQVSRQALVRDGIAYRDDGEGWHLTDQLPGIGLDPATLAGLAAYVGALSEATDVGLTEARPTTPPAEAPLGPETVAVDADVLAAILTGLRGPASPAVRALAAATVAADLPGIIAVDLLDATEIVAPTELRFDDAGRLVGLTVLARNIHFDVHDLLVETVISLRYPDSPPTLPMPEPRYVAPAPDPDGEAE